MLRSLVALAIWNAASALSVSAAPPASSSPGPSVIDFTPHPLTLKGDGSPCQALAILQGRQTVLLFPPDSWEVANGTAAGLGFTNKKLPSARFDLRNSSWKIPGDVDAAWLKTFTSTVLKGVPPGSINAKVVAGAAPATGYNRDRAYGVTVSYDYLGSPFNRSVVLLAPRPGVVLELVVTSVAKDFQTVRETSRNLYQTWQIPPQEWLRTQIVSR